MAADLDSWNRLMPLLDELLELDRAGQDARLEELGREDPRLRMTLEDLIASHRDAPEMLDDSFVPLVAEIPAGGTEDSRLGSVVGGYRLLERIGEGGMATVYRGARQDASFEHPVAIKLVRGDRTSPATVQRFRDEQRILASLSHPGIARLFDGGIAEDGQPFIVMELVDGSPLDTYCDEKRLDLDARLSLFCDVCEAIEYAHGNLVVHRDLKPGNILVTEKGEVKILDFGVAKLLESSERADSREDLTSLFGVPMTPAYAAPEQLEGGGVTTATDVYSLGLVLFELLTGKRAFTRFGPSALDPSQRDSKGDPSKPSQRVRVASENRKAAAEEATSERSPKWTREHSVEADSELSAHLRSTTVSKLLRQLRGDLDTIVLKALRNRPERRYGSVEALREDLERHLAKLPIRARPESWRYNLDRFLHRHRMAVVVGALAALSLVTALGVAVAGWNAARREAETSDRLSRFLVETFRAPDPTTHRPGGQISATELLTRAAERIHEDREAKPEVRARLTEAIAESFLGIGEFQQADDNVAESLRLWTELDGSDAVQTLATKNLQARIWMEMGKLREAEASYEELLAALERHPSEKGLKALVTNNFGILLHEDGDLERSEALFRQAMELRRQLGQLDSQHGLRLRNNLAVCRRAQGDLEEAEALLRGVLKSLREKLPEPHADIATAVNNLARLVRARGDLEEAEELYFEALQQRRAVFGEIHPDTAQSYNNIGAIHYFKEDFDGAAENFERAFGIWQEFFGGDHPRLSDSLSNIGALRRKQGRLEEADEALRRSVEMEERLNHPNHFRVAAALSRWAVLYLETARVAEGIALLERSVGILETTVGLEAESSVPIVQKLIQAYRDQGRAEDAVALLEKVSEAQSVASATPVSSAILVP